MSQPDSVRFRTLQVASAAVAAAPTDGVGGTAPHFQMSPIAPSGLPTTGFVFGLKGPSVTPAVAGAGGFTVSCWFRDPNTQAWFSSVSVSVSYGQLWTCPDVDAMDGVYFQIGNVGVAGVIYITFAEQ